MSQSSYPPTPDNKSALSSETLVAQNICRSTVKDYETALGVLDPRISYSGMKQNAISDARLLQLIDEAKRTLEEHFHSTYVICYQGDTISSDALMDNTETSVHDIVSLFSTNEPSNSNTELEEYFSMKQERS
ncbi:uncharacterized protein FOMMEDRAFT_161835 [Fomitiporia mediterranea MF3/22]|uniref:uncharacterized protein n=1 Tax=Fomitiporia mediterranea (strain MF3/22) TaxID=694068 RepID=UPI000440981F|nr:uncharacterized protein FOMMEDRAFT_161835 [Fomitiporia mediterranea MF3/22]EJC98462.1 hypothetical protein FOMMEDRAFT_161835 [Fomitiporia mediterranea MF3/22]